MIDDPVSTAIVIGGVAAVAAIAVSQRLHYRKLLNSTSETTSCPFCRTARKSTDGGCPECNFDTERALEQGLTSHVEALRTLDRVLDSLQQAYQRVGGPLGMLLGIMNIIDLGQSAKGRRRTEEATELHLRVLRELSDELDERFELFDDITSPGDEETVAQILNAAFTDSEPEPRPASSLLHKVKLPGAIRADIERIESVRELLADEIRRKSHQN